MAGSIREVLTFLPLWLHVGMSLQSIMLLQRNVPKAAKYYSLVGFRVQLLTEGWAELDAGTAKVVLKKAGCVIKRNLPI